MRLAVAFLILSCCVVHPIQVAAQVQPNPLATQTVGDALASGVTDPLNWKTQAKEVLNLISESGAPTKRGDVYTKLMELKPSNNEDPRFQLAYALLALQQKKFLDALSLSEQILANSPQYAPAQTLRARTLLLTEKRAPALAVLQALAKALIQPDVLASPAQVESSARFLGLTVGFFNGPGKDTIRPTALAELVAVAEKLPVELKIAYDSSRLAIEEEYRVLTEEGEEALKKLREGLEKEATLMREQLESQRAQVADQSEYAKAELQANFAHLNNQWQAAWNSSQVLAQQGDAMLARSVVLQASLNSVPPPRKDSQGRVDPVDQQRYLIEVNNLQNAIGSVNFQIASIAGQYNRIQNQGLLIEQQMQVTQARAQQLGMTLAMQNQSFAQLDAAIKQKELAAVKAEPKKKTSSQLRRERAFATYDDFNVHKEKQLLLEAIELQ